MPFPDIGAKFRRKPKRVGKPTSKAPVQKPNVRQAVVRFAHWGVANTKTIHYSESRPIPHTKPGVLPKLPLTTDCSGFATIAYQYAGASDPNGNHYNGSGFTGTLLAHGKHIPLSKVRPGDLAVFGCKTFTTGHHVTIVTAVHSRTLAGVELASHGSENGPLAITAATEAKFQPDGAAGIVWLRFL